MKKQVKNPGGFMRRHLFILVALMAASLTAQAQQDVDLGIDAKTLLKKWEAGLVELKKPSITPPAPTGKTETESVKFDEKKFEAKTQYTPPAPRVKKPEPPVWPALHNNFVKVGFGRYITPVVKICLNNGRSTTGDVGLEFNHISSSKGQVEFAEFREDYGTLKGSYLLDNNTLGAKLFVHNNSFFYYADTIVEGNPDLKDTISQGFTRISFDAYLKKNEKPGEVIYNVPLQFRSWSSKYQDRELQFSLMPNLHWTISEKFLAGIESNLTFSNSTVDSVAQSRFFLDITPSLAFKVGDFRLSAGLKIASFSDSSGIFRGLPILRAEYHFVPGAFSVNAGIRGDMVNRTFYDLTNENRYIVMENNIKPTIDNFHMYAGVDGNFAKYFNFSARAYLKKVENMPLFFNSQDGAYFSILYDTNFKETGAEFNLNFSKDDKIKAGMKANLRSFKTSNDTTLFNFGMPGTRVDLWGSYNFADKVWVTTEIFLYGKRTMSLDSNLVPITQDFQADINLHLEYRFSKRLSVFLDLNNLLGNQYYRWHNYLERPFDIKGGVTASF